MWSWQCSFLTAKAFQLCRKLGHVELQSLHPDNFLGCSVFYSQTDCYQRTQKHRFNVPRGLTTDGKKWDLQIQRKLTYTASSNFTLTLQSELTLNYLSVCLPYFLHLYSLLLKQLVHILTRCIFKKMWRVLSRNEGNVYNIET